MIIFHKSAVSVDNDPCSFFWYTIYVFENGDEMRYADEIKAVQKDL